MGSGNSGAAPQRFKSFFFEPRKRPQRERYFRRPRKVVVSRARGTRSGANHANETRVARVFRNGGNADSQPHSHDSFEFFPSLFPVKVARGVLARRRERRDHHEVRHLRTKVSPTKTSAGESNWWPRRMLLIRYSNWLRWLAGCAGWLCWLAALAGCAGWLAGCAGCAGLLAGWLPGWLHAKKKV